jgi:DNA invertase Pin-like site-specific DNA recombinase
VQALIANGSVNAIIALRQERLFRNTREALEYVDLWKQQGVTVYFAEDGGEALDATSPSGRLVFTVKAAASSFERDQTSLRVKENKASRKIQGKTYSPPRYGYDQVEGYEVPNLAEMENIRRIVEMRGEGYSLRQIAKVLSEEGHKTKKNKTKWSAQAVSDILERSMPQGDVEK